MTLRRVVLRPGADLDGFRHVVRRLVAEEVPPDAVAWDAESEGELFGADVRPLPRFDDGMTLPPPCGEGGPKRSGAPCGGPDERSSTAPSHKAGPPAPPREAEGSALLPGMVDEPPPLRLPRALGVMIQEAVPHRDPERYGLLYGVIWRVLHGEREILEVASDPAIHRLHRMRTSVRRDIHKMHAYLRFREVPRGTDDGGPERFVAWFEPDHYILEAAAPFFEERFRSMIWTILTPVGSAHWDGERLHYGPPATRADAPDADGFEAGWTGYYESTFNPARANPKLMRQHMAKKYWHNLPEAAAIPALVRQAGSRADAMIGREPTMPQKREPKGALAAMLDQAPASLPALNAIIRASGPLVPGATQAVVGEGPAHAGIVFVGEQPGDEEDRQGRPFVGPAGRLLDRAFEEAGIERREVYLTNAVKHFKFELRGKRRIHAKPTAGEVSHYRWWLMRELELIEPKLVVALGATAVLALTGKTIPITRARGPAKLLESFAGFITVHPSYLLRLPDEDAKRDAYGAFVADMRQVKSLGEAARGAA